MFEIAASGFARGCGKTPASIYAQKILLDFVNLKINNARQRYREEALEKTILRILASCVFSHSLAPIRTSGLERSPYGSEDSEARSIRAATVVTA